jgi:hypothetical protein
MAKKPDRSVPAHRTAILVLGMHRSGTSALARIVNFLGASMPRQLVPANEANPRGYWESAPLVALHEQMLAEMDSSWDDWRAPPARFRDSDIAARYAVKIRAAIDEEFPNQPLIALKDPRICRTLPFWMSTLEKAGIRSAPLLVVRNPLEVAESLRERDNIPFEKAMLLWLRHNLDAEYETRHLSRNIVTFDALLEDWKLLAVQSGARLGLQWPRQPNDAASDVREFLDIELHNHRSTLAELEAHTEVPHWVKHAYRALTLLCDEPKAAEPKRELDRMRTAFAESARIFGVVAFAQTEALKQAEKTASEATARADKAEAIRADLNKSREEYKAASARIKALESEVKATKARSADLEKMSTDLEAALGQVKTEVKDASSAADDHQRRSEQAVQRVTALMKDIADLEKKRIEAQETVRRAAEDTKELQKLAKHLTDRTEAIEGQLKAQMKKSDKAHAEMEEARGRAVTALANAMDLSKQLAAAKEQIHTHETRVIKAQAEARQHQEALIAARERIAELEANERDILAESAELRAELTDAYNVTGESTGATKQAAHAPHGDVESRARRIEEDLRFERMHVQHLERRLSSWSGIATAALRKITRLGRKPAPAKRKPVKRIAAPVGAR